jgi:hypothetical protein
LFDINIFVGKKTSHYLVNNHIKYKIKIQQSKNLDIQKIKLYKNITNDKIFRVLYLYISFPLQKSTKLQYNLFYCNKKDRMGIIPILQLKILVLRFEIFLPYYKVNNNFFYINIFGGKKTSDYLLNKV